jgi:UDP-N-acetylmuramoyl-L-alanyl-D-glutamate--2,6-diaminopimelate ligase
MNKLLVYLKKIIPQKLFKKLQPIYHYIFNFLAALFYRFPANQLIVIGITGTTGKTTTVFMIAEMLKKAGLKVGYTSTAVFSDGNQEVSNDKKMTMLGRFFTQKMLRKMVKNKCQIAIIETTSEGAVQFRHRFINYDAMVFTGIYPEHIDSHGSFQNYKQAKLKLFQHLEECKNKKLFFEINLRNDEEEWKQKANKLIIKDLAKTSIVNLDDEFAVEFLNYSTAKIGFTKKTLTESQLKKLTNFKSDIQDSIIKNKSNLQIIEYRFLEMNSQGTKFDFAGKSIQLKVLGEFNAKNATIAGAVGLFLGLSKEQIKIGLENVVGIPGRLERIEEGQNFTVIVDYAFEPVAVEKLYETISFLKPRKIIHLLGSCGGGRDVARREKLGYLAGKQADLVIITNEDPYDEDPLKIIQAVAEGSKKAGKIEEKNLFLIEDRAEAIHQVIHLAEKDDVVLITGKGSEQAMAVKNGELIPWDDRQIVRKVLKKIAVRK